MPGPLGDLEVIVTGAALEVLRGSGYVFQDGGSLIRHYRSFIAEVALEKYQESEERSQIVVLNASDVAG